ncbi:hypothetical protein FGO68_gene14306 [Halteria grandinella]|uniref:Uncharacterized protein n=1 Tax=Halteria grandinella TaxID=5974 RepID=A0A8J8T9S5_HALGN|nr:hypothetical protein FGO68_gene14306 [Halteria grandinella]
MNTRLVCGTFSLLITCRLGQCLQAFGFFGEELLSSFQYKLLLVPPSNIYSTIYQNLWLSSFFGDQACPIIQWTLQIVLLFLCVSSQTYFGIDIVSMQAEAPASREILATSIPLQSFCTEGFSACLLSSTTSSSAFSMIFPMFEAYSSSSSSSGYLSLFLPVQLGVVSAITGMLEASFEVVRPPAFFIAFLSEGPSLSGQQITLPLAQPSPSYDCSSLA